MKRTVIFLLIVFFCTSFAGCSNDKDAISSPEDLVGKRIGVLSGSAAEIFCTDIENAEITSYINADGASSDLQNGDIDAIVTDRTVAKKIVNAVSGLKMLSDPAFEKEYYVLAVQKENYDVLGLINVVLAEADTDGRLSDITEGYIGKTSAERREFYETQTQAFEATDFSEEVLTVGVCPGFAPFVYKEDGDLMGIDIEIARLIAEKVSMQLQFVEYEESELISALRRGDIDFIISALTSDERYSTQLDYSDSYYTSIQSIIIAY